MKLPEALTKLLQKKEDGKEYFFSLYMDTGAAAVAVWHVDATKQPHIVSFAHGAVRGDTWDDRIAVVDRLLSAAEDKVGVEKPITKTVFGLPPAYLTKEGNISPEIRPHLKKLTKLLELSAVGFVPLTQSIAFSLKKDEGVPPSVILISGSRRHEHVSLFRVGKLTSDDPVDFGEDPAPVLEKLLKTHQDGDVLPSRVLLYGGDTQALEDIRAKLLKHPWPTRVNFLHFPKISIIPLETLLKSVSLAGAAELSSDMGDAETTESAASSAVAQQTYAESVAARSDTADAEWDGDGEKDEHEEAADDEAETVVDDSEDEMADDHEKADVEEEENEHNEDDGDIITEAPPEEIANVEMVTPESLGFQKRDVLEKSDIGPHTSAAGKSRVALEDDLMDDDIDSAKKVSRLPHLPIALPGVSFGWVSGIVRRLSRLRLHRRGNLPLIIGAVVLAGAVGASMYMVPRATVTVLVAPQTIEESAVVTVDPKATIADPKSNIIPGRKLEKSISGEKTIAVTGTKNIGDPAKGTVTIINKVTASKTFSKGTVISANSLSFTLDDDVTIASASEDFTGRTFGKATVDVTAKEIGPNGNEPAGTEFTFENTSSSQAVARNDSAFTGGTSKKVTVVSRADQDSLVKQLTADLVDKAKSQLLDSATGGERLIDETVETKVSDKTFDQEINAEAKQLHGKVTITVGGLSIRDEDIKSILTTLVSDKVPAGYALSPDQTEISVSKATVKKDGSITLTAKLKAAAVPIIDAVGLRAKLAGKDVQTALSILKQGKGIAGAEFRFVLSPTKGRLPFNAGNITITTMIQ